MENVEFLQQEKQILARGAVKGDRFTVKILPPSDAFKRYQSVITDLAANCTESNVFYESWMLSAACRHLVCPSSVRLMLIFEASRLIAVFPIMRQRSFKGLFLPHWTNWIHIHCFFASPLIREHNETSALEAVTCELARQSGYGFLHIQRIAADGPLYSALKDISAKGAQHVSFESDCHERAVLSTIPLHSGNPYTPLSRERKKDLRRKRRQLAEQGELELRVLNHAPDAEDWIDTFMKIEAAGWRGSQGTALDQHPKQAAFFREIIREGVIRKQLVMTALYFDGRPIAMRCDLITNQTAFAFKMTYDEQYARYSPGVLLDFEHLQYLAHHTPVQFVDSCAMPNHSLFSRFWSERRRICSMVVSTPRLRSQLTVYCLALLQAGIRSGKQILQAIARKRNYRPKNSGSGDC